MLVIEGILAFLISNLFNLDIKHYSKEKASDLAQVFELVVEMNCGSTLLIHSTEIPAALSSTHVIIISQQEAI